MKKIKLLFLVSSLKKCGPINVLFGIVKNLDEDKFDVSILCLSKENESSMKSDFSNLGCSIVNLDNSRLKGIVQNERMVHAFVQKEGIDIVHSHGLRADLINASLKNVIRFSTIHNFPDEDYILQYGRLKGALMASKHRHAFKGIENLVACSSYIQKRFTSDYALNSSCIQNGIDTDMTIENDNERVHALRIKLGLDLDKTIFVVCGSLIKRKEPETILKAFSKMDLDSASILLLGSGKLENKLKQSYVANNILFKGNVNNVTDYLSASDYFVSASVSEGLPIAVMEAMFAGLGIILSDISSHREIVGKDYPLLFPVHNHDALEEIMQAIFNGEYKNLIQSNQELITSHFNAVSMAKKYQKLYLQGCRTTEK